MQEVRCKHCNKFYAKASVFIGVIRCSRCKMVFEYKIIPNLSVNEMYDPDTVHAILKKETEESKPHNAARQQ